MVFLVSGFKVKRRRFQSFHESNRLRLPITDTRSSSGEGSGETF